MPAQLGRERRDCGCGNSSSAGVPVYDHGDMLVCIICIFKELFCGEPATSPSEGGGNFYVGGCQICKKYLENAVWYFLVSARYKKFDVPEESVYLRESMLMAQLHNYNCKFLKFLNKDISCGICRKNRNEIAGDRIVVTDNNCSYDLRNILPYNLRDVMDKADAKVEAKVEADVEVER